jgi:drug/metabolite transporter (DMT)-like permease
MQPAVSHLYLPVLAIALGAAFARRELRTLEPFIDLRVLGGNAPLLATYARQVLAFVVTYSFLYGFTQWLEEGRSLSASAAGLVLLPMSAAAIVITAITGRGARVRGKLVAGGILLVVAGAGLQLADQNSAVWLLVLLGVTAGFPQGLNGLANQNALYHQADPARMGSSAGLLRTATYVGALIAAAANATFFKTGADTTGLHHLSWFLLGITGLLLVVTLLDRPLSQIGSAQPT